MKRGLTLIFAAVFITAIILSFTGCGVREAVGSDTGVSGVENGRGDHEGGQVESTVEDRGRSGKVKETTTEMDAARMENNTEGSSVGIGSRDSMVINFDDLEEKYPEISEKLKENSDKLSILNEELMDAYEEKDSEVIELIKGQMATIKAENSSLIGVYMDEAAASADRD